MTDTSRVLFDAPGPRARRRIAVVTVASILVIAGLIALALVQFAKHHQLDSDRWEPFTRAPYIRFLWQGVKGTLKATAVAAVLSFPLGALMALLRLSPNRVVRWIARIYIEIFRSVPLLLLIYAFLLALPRYRSTWSGFNLPIFWKLVVPIVLVNVAILAEVFRAGVNSLDSGQSEAGKAIGLTYWQTMRLVVFPQAIRVVIPLLITGLVSLLKDTTLGYVVSYPELMKTATTLTGLTHILIQTYLIVALVYVVVNALLSQLAHYIERRLRRGRRSAGAARVVGDLEAREPAVAVMR
ncbi:MAG: amino acid ABC transporter permease [Jatrophihabitans sp.]